MPASIVATSSLSSGCEMSIPETSAAKTGWIGWMVMLILGRSLWSDPIIGAALPLTIRAAAIPLPAPFCDTVSRNDVVLAARAVPHPQLPIPVSGGPAHLLGQR